MKDFVKTALCPRCQSTRTIAALQEDGRVLIRGCNACGYEWDKSDVAERIERLTLNDFYEWVARERKEGDDDGR